MSVYNENPSDDLPNKVKNQLDCLMIGNRGFIYKREIKKRIMKLSDLIEEGKLKQRKN